MCSRSLLVTEGVPAPADQGSTTSSSSLIARRSDAELRDDGAAEPMRPVCQGHSRLSCRETVRVAHRWQQTSATHHQVVPTWKTQGRGSVADPRPTTALPLNPGRSAHIFMVYHA
jgi:hypothetical protein